MKLAFISEIYQFFEVFATDVLSVHFLDLGHQEIKFPYLLLVLSEEGLNQVFGTLTIEEGEGLIDDVGFGILLLVGYLYPCFGLLYPEFLLLLLLLFFLFSMGRTLSNHYIFAMPATLTPHLLSRLRRGGLKSIDILKSFLYSL